MCFAVPQLSTRGHSMNVEEEVLEERLLWFLPAQLAVSPLNLNEHLSEIDESEC